MFFTCKDFCLSSYDQAFSVLPPFSFPFPVFTRSSRYFAPVMLTFSNSIRYTSFGSRIFRHNSLFFAILLLNSCEHNIHVMFTISYSLLSRAFATEKKGACCVKRSRPIQSIFSEGFISYCGGKCNSQRNRQ